MEFVLRILQFSFTSVIRLVYRLLLIVSVLVLFWFSILFCWITDYHHLDDSLNVVSRDAQTLLLYFSPLKTAFIEEF